ncbi:MAG: hypothetical protein FWH26_05075 [Oscillospiraceae bacterium]|nr:hypothetical protein [Oscillospiraceae bacterium]
MWNGELNPMLGKIPEIREIDAYLRDVTFQRRLLGCDPDEVRDCLAEVARRYKAVAASLLPQQGQDWQLQELRERIAQLERENSGLREWARWYEQENAALRAENTALRAAQAQGGLVYYN